MRPFANRRPACQWGHRESAEAASETRVGQGLGATADAPRGHPSLTGAAGAFHGQDPRLLLNRLFLSGVLVADPQEDIGRDGEAVTLLLIAFPAPDSSGPGTLETASCEVEVPTRIFVRYAKELRAGGPIFITGQLNGGGGVIATEIHTGPLADQATDTAYLSEE